MSDTLGTFRRRLLPVVAAFGFSACGDQFTLPPAQLFIAEQQLNLYALTGTAVRTPSA